MKEWNKLKANKLLFVLAILSAAVTILEGLLYFSSYEDVFFRILLTLQNTIKAFTFKSTISLESARSFMLKDPTPFKTVLGYAYMLSVFTAPYCTIATVYKLMERAFRFGFFLNKASRKERVVIFGYNETVKSLLRSANAKQRRIHVVCSENAASEELYRLFRSGIQLHTFDPLKVGDADNDRLNGFFNSIELSKAGNILLMEDSSIRNFSLLQTLDSTGRLEKKDRQRPPKVFCRCEDDGILRIIEGYYDTASNGMSHKNFDLEILNIPEQQVRKMYDKGASLHSYWLKSSGKAPTAPRDWQVHLLILGFGKLGQQALLQAMNLGVTHSENRICIDVVDKDLDEKRNLFFSRFAPDAFVEDDASGKDVFCINPDWADGSLTIRFHQLDVKYGAFRTLLGKLTDEGAGPITYAVAAMDDADTGVYCATELRRFLLESDPEHSDDVPIMLRMDSDRRLQKYLKSSDGMMHLVGVGLIEAPESVLNFEDLLDRTPADKAKQCNSYYANMTFSDDPSAPLMDKSPQELWDTLTLFRRNANRASAYHNDILEKIVDTRTDDWVPSNLNSLFEADDAPVRWNGDTWSFPFASDHEGFLKRVHQEKYRFLFEMLKTEHRRWCYYTLSLGWSQGRSSEKNDALRWNPCLVTWDDLEKSQPKTCKYDLMPLMSIYQKKNEAAQTKETKEGASTK